MRTGECPEELALDQRFRKGVAVDLEEVHDFIEEDRHEANAGKGRSR
jgi:hypothetical protein